MSVLEWICLGVGILGVLCCVMAILKPSRADSGFLQNVLEAFLELIALALSGFKD